MAASLPSGNQKRILARSCETVASRFNVRPSGFRKKYPLGRIDSLTTDQRLPPCRADGGDCPLPRQEKSSRVIIYLSAQVEHASRVGKTTRAAGYKGEFAVVEYAWDWCRGQGPGERARNTVAVGSCKYVAADIGQVADIEDEFRRSVEAAQLRRIPPVDGFNKHVALVQRHSRNDCTRDNPVERDLVAG